MLFSDCGVKTIQIFEARDISLNGRDVLADLRGRFVQLLFATPGDHDPRPFFNEALCCRQTDTAVSTSDHCDFPRKFPHGIASFTRLRVLWDFLSSCALARPS